MKIQVLFLKITLVSESSKQRSDNFEEGDNFHVEIKMSPSSQRYDLRRKK
jgi:hypothetical protein